MAKRAGEFKRPPKRHWPRGLAILYEDHDIVVVDKAPGLLTVGNAKVRESTAHHLLCGYVRKGNSRSRRRVFIVHRLDRDTSGLIVFAKSEEAKYALQEAWHRFQKKYLAVVHGSLKEPEGVITSYLAENSIHKVYSVNDPKRGKLARTGYKVLQESPKFSLLEIDLMTGRKNQIRVHLAEHGNPIAGDKKYGIREKGIRRLALHSTSLRFVHPHTRKLMTIDAPPPPFFEYLMKR